MVVPSRHQSACGIQSVVGYYPEDRMFILVYRLGEDGGLHYNEGADMLLIWTLRARSYKTRAEA